MAMLICWSFVMLILEFTFVESANQASCQTCDCVEGAANVTSAGDDMWALSYSGSLYSVNVVDFSPSSCRYSTNRWIISNSNSNYDIILTITPTSCTPDTTNNGPYIANCTADNSMIRSTLSVNNLDASQTNSVISFSSDCAEPKQCARWTIHVGECESCAINGTTTSMSVTPCGFECKTNFSCTEPAYTGNITTAICQADATWNDPCQSDNCMAVTCSNNSLSNALNSAEGGCGVTYVENYASKYDYSTEVILTCPNSTNTCSGTATAKAICNGVNIWTIADCVSVDSEISTPSPTDQTTNQTFVSETNPQTLDAGQIVGIVIGCVVGVAIIGGLAFCVIKKRGEGKSEEKVAYSKAPTDAPEVNISDK